jgi:hypothetical protein
MVVVLIMDPAFLVIVFVFITLVYIISQIAIFFLLRQHLDDVKKTVKGDVDANNDLKAKTDAIIQKAITDADQIIAQAQAKGANLLDTEKISGDNIAVDYKKHLEEVEKALSDQFAHAAASAEEAYKTFIAQSEDAIKKQISDNHELLAAKSQAMIDQSKTQMDAFTADVQGKIKALVETEITNAKTEIEEYKTARIAIINERIIDILEEVMTVTLAKKLTLSDQSELVYRALDEAKKNNAFVEKKIDEGDKVIK